MMDGASDRQKVTHEAAIGSETLRLVTDKLSSHIVGSSLDLGDAVVAIKPEGLLDFFKLLKMDADLQFSMLVNVTAVDYMDERDERFELVYHLLSLSKGHRLRVKVEIPEQAASVDSLVALWASADFMEREVWDMFGIAFKGHPNLSRILMYEEFQGFPLRKDYPLQGKQPRIPLRAPEVENSARLMNRPDLVQIGRPK